MSSVPWPRGALCLIYGLSVLGKVKAMLGAGHPAFGPGKCYPSALLPGVVVLETATIALLLTGDVEAGLLGSAAMLGGVLYTQVLPVGPFAKMGAKALLPMLLAGGLHLRVALTASRAPFKSALLGVAVPRWAAAGAAVASALFGAAMHAANAGGGKDQ
jgi:hypothetical protein